MRVDAAGLVIGVVIHDHALAARVVEASRAMGIEAIWATSISAVPLRASYIVASKRSSITHDGRKIVYVEDYSSVECMLLSLVLGSRRGGDERFMAVAIDPGRRIGAAFIVDGVLLFTDTYNSSESLIRKCLEMIYCFRDRCLEFYVGAANNEYAAELIKSLKMAFPNSRIIQVSEEGSAGSIFYCDRPVDERSALRIYLRARSRVLP